MLDGLGKSEILALASGSDPGAKAPVEVSDLLIGRTRHARLRARFCPLTPSTASVIEHFFSFLLGY